MQTVKLKGKLDLLTKDKPAQFGIMTPQHMVEHLILTFKLSQGKISLPEKIPSPKAIQAKKAVLYGNMDLPRGIKAPGLGDELLDLRYGTLEESKAQLVNSFTAFHRDIQHYHPAFGRLKLCGMDRFP